MSISQETRGHERPPFEALAFSDNLLSFDRWPVQQVSGSERPGQDPHPYNGHLSPGLTLSGTSSHHPAEYGPRQSTATDVSLGAATPISPAITEPQSKSPESDRLKWPTREDTAADPHGEELSSLYEETYGRLPAGFTRRPLLHANLIGELVELQIKGAHDTLWRAEQHARIRQRHHYEAADFKRLSVLDQFIDNVSNYQGILEHEDPHDPKVSAEIAAAQDPQYMADFRGIANQISQREDALPYNAIGTDASPTHQYGGYRHNTLDLFLEAAQALTQIKGLCAAVRTAYQRLHKSSRDTA